jgi:hypothetical protein
MLQNTIKAIFTSIALFFIIANNINAQTCKVPKKEVKIRVFGDSWAHFPVIYKAYDSALVQYGFPEYISNGDFTVLISMNSEAFLYPIAKALWQPQIEKDGRDGTPLMVISLLGNDIAFKIRKDKPLSILDAPLAEAKTNMDTIFDFIHEKCPNMKILWMCYDFPNFVDPIIDYPWNPYAEMWEDKDRFTPAEVNPFINYMAHLQDSLVGVWNRPYLHFVNNVGLMQYMYGQPTPLRVAPFGTYPKYSVPFPGGDENYPTPHAAMGLGGIDTYHLSPQGYTFLASYQMRKFFMDYLREDKDTTIQSLGGNYDGYVSTTSTGNQSIKVGKTAGQETSKGITTFNTAFIEDDIRIKKASLFIRRKEGNYKSYPNQLYPNNIKLDIISGTFGNETIELSDFNATSSKEDIACAFGNTSRDNYSIRFDIHEEALQYINKNGLTQFRISIVDTAQGESIVHYYTGDTSMYDAPYLDLYYDSNRIVSSIKEIKNHNITIYPNPTKNIVNIERLNSSDFANNLNIRVYSTSGNQLMHIEHKKSDKVQINLKDIANGNYILRIDDGSSFISEQILKYE